jgi:hypothetical protein
MVVMFNYSTSSGMATGHCEGCAFTHPGRQLNGCVSKADL